ncbi:ABC transporter ATP-binding protein [Bifidobacterium oedipodis]|uniref:Multidrug ABC transporter ATP-binding protein n=1 Tax=Bifidobacterium oedipodis TaxID=2675322 RepID=A0A7Y0EQY7_9BIFI|nr:ABC transporter ATP-binding protein [Bifidobacterium sp. DSM 109957]NMM94780.1 multidrug ABC transporter ATP-binding protein [Bifidobacterium sp. DSM 109957]
MRLLFRFLKPYTGLVAAALFALLLDVAGALLVPTILAEMINVGADGGTDHILPMGGVMLAVTVISGLGALGGSYLGAKLCSNVGRDMRNAIYDSSLRFADSDFKQFGTGSMITRTLNDINVVQQTLMLSLQMLVPVPIMCVMGIALAFSLDVVMGWVLLGVVVSVVALTVIIVAKAAPIFERLQRYIDRMNTVLRENITGVRVIRAFGRDNHERKRLGKAFSDYATSAIRVNTLFAGLDSFTFFLMNIVIVIVMWLGGDRVGVHAMQIGDITALIEYAMWILFYIMMAGFVMFMVPRGLVCLGRAREVITYQPSIADPQPGVVKASQNAERIAQPGTVQSDGSQSDSVQLDSAQPPSELDAAHPKVACFDHLSFRFADGSEDTLQDLTFSCRRGQTTAIIGPTGSGKSTIARLMLRLIDATEGRVLIDGRDVREMTQRELRNHIAYVPQKAWLFSGTIADNLRYGDSSATDEELWHALDVAQGRFVRELPDGLESRVAQGGTNFSGGQRQRLAIARALAKKADLYIFDDSFSALDFATDAALRKALASEMTDAAMLIIAQRVSTIVHADQIIVLEDGKVRGRGTHEELMRDCPTYREIAQSQMKAAEAGKEAN